MGISSMPLQRLSFTPALSSSSHGHHFVIAATDYFTKWVEAIPMALTDWKGVACLIYTHLLY